MTVQARIGSCLLAAIAAAAAPLALRASGQTPPPAVAPASEPPSPQQAIHDDIGNLTDVLLNPDNRTLPDQREQAAERLLNYGREDAIGPVLTAAQTTSGPANVDMRVAVARALAALPQPPDSRFIEPLRGLLANDPQAATTALARYATTPQAADVLNLLIDFVQNGRATDWARTAAVNAIGAFGSHTGAQFLITLLNNPAQKEELRNSAADALVNMTGLQQNGRDATRWNNWWQVASTRPEDQWSAIAPGSARSFEIEHNERDLATRVDGLLRKMYQSAGDPREQEALELSWLRDAQPALRNSAVGIALQQTLLQKPLSRDVRQQLRSMVSDASPDVRRNVVITLRDITETAAAGQLIAQLDVETDNDVKIAIASALGKFHQLSSVDALLKLLDNPNMRVAAAAADALKGDRGEFAAVIRSDPATLARVTSRLRTKLESLRANRPAGSDDLYAGLLGAAARLGVRELLPVYESALNPTEPEPVRLAAVQGLGSMTDPADKDRAAQRLVAAITDDRAGASIVRYRAVQELRKVGTLSAVRATLQERADPANGRELDKSVRDEAWQTLLALAAADEVPARDAIELADVAARTAGLTDQERAQRRVAMLEVAVPKLQKLAAAAKDDAKRLDYTRQVADRQQDIGDGYFKLRRFDQAFAHYDAALSLWQAPDMDASPRTIDNLTERIERSHLEAGKFKEAIAFASQRAQTGPEERAFMGSLIRNHVDSLMKAGKLKEANQLAEEALGNDMRPPLDPDMAQELRDDQRQIREQLSSQGKQGAAAGNGDGGFSFDGDR